MGLIRSVARYRWVILGLALLAQISTSLVGLVLAPLAPLFQPELGLSKAEVGLFASATYVGGWSMCLISGTLVDRFGVRRMMAVSQLASGALLLSMATAGSIFRAVLVMFAAGAARMPMSPGSTKAILDWFPPSARATVMGLKQSGMPVAGILIAPTLPALALIVGWRSAIALVGFFIIASGLVTAVLYREPGRPGQPSERRVSMLASLRATTGNRRLWMASCIALLFVGTQMASITYLALYFMDVVLVEWVPEEPARIVAAGGYLALCQLGGAFGRVFWGAVSDRAFRRRRATVMVVVGALSSLSSLAMGNLRPDFPMWLLAVVVIALGASAVGWNGAYLAWLGEMVDRKHVATGVGLSMTLSETGSIGAPPLFGFVADVTGSYQASWFLLSLLCVGGALVALLAARGQANSPQKV